MALMVLKKTSHDLTHQKHSIMSSIGVVGTRTFYADIPPTPLLHPPTHILHSSDGKLCS